MKPLEEESLKRLEDLKAFFEDNYSGEEAGKITHGNFWEMTSDQDFIDEVLKLMESHFGSSFLDQATPEAILHEWPDQRFPAVDNRFTKHMSTLWLGNNPGSYARDLFAKFIATGEMPKLNSHNPIHPMTVIALWAGVDDPVYSITKMECPPQPSEATEDYVVPLIEPLFREGIPSSYENMVGHHYARLYPKILHSVGKLTFKHYEFAVNTYSSFPHLSTEMHPNSDERPADDEVGREGESYTDVATRWQNRLTMEAIECITEENANLITRVKHYSGSHFLIKACENIERLGLKTVNQDDNSRVVAAVARLADQKELSEDVDSLREKLAGFSKKTLRTVAINAGAASDLILGMKELGANPESVPFIKYFLSLDNPAPYEQAFANSPDPSQGVFPIAELQRLQQPAGSKGVGLLIDVLKSRGREWSNGVTVVEALFKPNWAKLEKAMKRHGQIAVKAFGCMPLDENTGHEEQVLERYKVIKDFEKGARKYGSERKANTIAAAAAGISNLAQVAGYPSTADLELAMEIKLGSDLPTDLIDDPYHVKVAFEDGAPVIHVEKAGKALKTIPAALKKKDKFKDLSSYVAESKEQAKRFRHTFESAMSAGRIYSLSEISGLCSLPMIREMLSRLVFCDSAGNLGFLIDGELHGLKSAKMKPEGDLRIAHPLDLLYTNQLAEWQKQLFESRVVQPFRQVFREIYVPTPAEKEAVDHSMRFADRNLDDRKTAKLLTSRDWELNGIDGPIIRKTWKEQEVRGFLELSTPCHYLGELGEITTDKVIFRPINDDIESCGQGLNLVDIDPRVFSETMRDIDLVVSVAASDAEKWLSLPAITTRKDLLDSILADLKISGVTSEGKYAYVEGKLARYRIHLGTGHIYLDPGEYLCIVPAKSVVRDKKLFLPFADDADPKLAEIFSKILMLSNDHKIKDRTILEQIERKNR